MGLCHLQRHERRPDRLRIRQPDLHDLGAQRLQETHCGVEHCLDGLVEPDAHEVGRDADAGAVKRIARYGDFRRRQIRRAGRVDAIRSTHGPHHHRRVPDRPAQRSRGVERGCERHSARAADPAEGGLQTGHSTEAGRDADRAPRVAAHRHRDHPRRDGGA